MVVIASDTFIRANQTGWRLASDGVNTWGSVIGAAYTQNIVSDKGELAGVAGFGYNFLGSLTRSDMEVYFRVEGIYAALGRPMALLRATSTNTMYQVELTTTTAFRIYKLISGTQTQLATASVTTTLANTPYRIRARVQGSAIYGKWWPDASTEPSAWTVTVASDTSITAAGQFGVGIDSPNTAGKTNYDSLTVDDLTTTPPPSSSYYSGLQFVHGVIQI